MSETSQGPGWWQASDGRWYPPQPVSEMHDFDDGNGPVQAHRHPNGGGWVANTATVAETAFVDQEASVFGYSRVLDSAAVTGTAWVLGAAEVSGSARIAGDAEVGESGRVSGSALVTDNARVAGDALVSGETIVSGDTWIENGTPKGPDWWQASNGNWYTPEQHPDFAAPPPPQQPGPPPATIPEEGGPVGPIQKTNSFAIAAIICGCLAIVPVLGFFTTILAIIFGFVAWRQVKRTGGIQKGARIAIAGMVIAVPLFVVGEAILVANRHPTATVAISSKSVPTTTRPKHTPTTTRPKPASSTTAISPPTTSPPPTTTPPPVSQIGQTVNDGDFAFVVQSFTCGASVAAAVNSDGYGETIPAGAQECLATMSVMDDKATAQTFFASNQYAYDAAGHRYSADSTGSIYLSNSNAFAQVNPGVTITALVPFQVPASVQLVSLELHDSAFSGGVSVHL